MLATSLRPGITRNPEHLLRGTPLGIEYLKQGKYISGDERGGFHVAKVNLPVPDARLRLFIQGKEDWLEEGLLVPTKKNKRGRIVEDLPMHKRVVHNLTMCHHSEGSLLLLVITEGHKCKHGGWCTGAPPNYVVPSVTFAEPYAQYPQPQQSMAIIGGYVARNMQNVAAIQSNATQLVEGHANIAYEL
jgi:hypothetical protein